MTDPPKESLAYLAHLTRQMVTIDVEHEGKIYTVRYRPARMVTATAKYQEAGDTSVRAQLKLLREIIAEVRINGISAGPMRRLATTSPGLLGDLAMAVGEHFEQWNRAEAGRFHGGDE
jgi:enoyl-[acyl-carrier-protein] reductase (NADH)